MMASIELRDGMLYSYCPYNPSFIIALRKKDRINAIKWNKVTKNYYAIFSTRSLRILVTTLAEHFSVVDYCPTLERMLSSVKGYTGGEIWSPTLMRSGNLFYIAASNNALDVAIKDIRLSDDIPTLSLLAEHGVNTHDSIVNGDPVLTLAAKYIAEVDYVQMDALIRLLIELNCTRVFVNGVGMEKKYVNIMEERLMAAYCNEINVSHEYTPARVALEKYPVLFNLSSYAFKAPLPNIRKVINMKNSTPILIS